MEGEKSKAKLVAVCPESEVVIDFALGRKCRANVSLCSLCSASPVAFKVQTSSPSRFLVNPPSGIIPPLSTVTFQIILRPQAQLPSTYPRSPCDRFLVRAAVFGQAESKAAESVNSWISSRPPGATQDIKLKVAFAGTLLLHHAVSCGDTDSVRKLIKRRNTILAELSPEEADSLLQVAAGSDNSMNMAKLLVELGLGFRQMGADVSHKGEGDPDCSSEKEAALLMSATRGDLKQLKSLLKGGAVPIVSDQYGLTALHAASIKGHSEVVEMLCRHGMELDIQDNEGHTPLHLAVEGGNMATVEALIVHGANVNATTRSGVTPLYLAKAMGYRDITSRLEGSGAVASVHL